MKVGVALFGVRRLLSDVSLDVTLDGVEFSVLPSGAHAIDSDVMYIYPTLLYSVTNRNPAISRRGRIKAWQYFGE
jgi:hypothetical protein